MEKSKERKSTKVLLGATAILAFALSLGVIKSIRTLGLLGQRINNIPDSSSPLPKAPIPPDIRQIPSGPKSITATETKIAADQLENDENLLRRKFHESCMRFFETATSTSSNQVISAFVNVQLNGSRFGGGWGPTRKPFLQQIAERCELDDIQLIRPLNNALQKGEPEAGYWLLNYLNETCRESVLQALSAPLLARCSSLPEKTPQAVCLENTWHLPMLKCDAVTDDAERHTCFNEAHQEREKEETQCEPLNSDEKQTRPGCEQDARIKTRNSADYPKKFRRCIRQTAQESELSLDEVHAQAARYYADDIAALYSQILENPMRHSIGMYIERIDEASRNIPPWVLYPALVVENSAELHAQYIEPILALMPKETE